MTTSFPSERSEDHYLAAIESLVGQIIQSGGFNLKSTVRKYDASDGESNALRVVIDFEGPDSDLLLEKNAALLDALEYVVLKAVHVDDDLYGRISFDCKDWRQVRAEELKLTAQMAARQAVETGSPFHLTPMSSRERRIVHLALKDEASVKTMSEGAGTSRKVVIYPAASPS
ncbi:MAG TPA: R3H domain-containing nucleic acid-binding protein [Terriglobia bacterium]|nr:R3H domain-containing nucleic acid-binding protein [Terriglobia bacterium]